MRKVKVGRVVSDRMNKTVVIRVERSFRHPRYGKVIKRAKRFKAHDAKNECRVGDRVEIVEVRPLSKDKRWQVAKILEKAK